MDFLRIVFSLLLVSILPLNHLGLFQNQSTREVSYMEKEEIIKKQAEPTEFSFTANDICVSPDGDDKNPGTERKPLKTLEAAKNLAAQKRNNGLKGHIHVWFKEGTYFFESTVDFTETDADDVSYLSYPGQKVVFTGGIEVTGFSADTLNGVACVSAPLESTVSFASVTKNGTRISSPRYPETGYFKVANTDHSIALYPESADFWKDYCYGENGFIKDDTQKLTSFYDEGNVRVHLLHYWVGELSYVRGYDEELNAVLITKPCSMKVEKDTRYYFENVKEMFGKAGEYYYDFAAQRLYYVPVQGENTAELTLTACTDVDFIHLNGCKNITFEGITFENTASAYPTAREGSWLEAYGVRHPQAEIDCGGAVECNRCEKILFYRCNFNNVAEYGILFEKACKNCKVTSCNFIGMGAGGVFIDGVNTRTEEDITEYIEVSDNVIQGYGRFYCSAIGVLSTHARHVSIIHNQISDGCYTAVSVGWVWGYTYSVSENNLISANLIYDIGQGWLSDMGGIYTLGIQKGTQISYNKIFNVAADETEQGYGGWGIYLDEGSSYIKVHHNLVYDCGSQGFHQHYGKENELYNNIFALNRGGQTRYTRTEEHMGFTLSHNIFLSDNQPIYSHVDAGKYADDNNMYWDLYNREMVLNSVGEDLSFKNREAVKVTQLRGLFQDAVIENPMFLNPTEYDFTLPQLTEGGYCLIGFEPWNYDVAGTLTAR